MSVDYLLTYQKCVVYVILTLLFTPGRCPVFTHRNTRMYTSIFQQDPHFCRVSLDFILFFLIFFLFLLNLRQSTGGFGGMAGTFCSQREWEGLHLRPSYFYEQYATVETTSFIFCAFFVLPQQVHQLSISDQYFYSILARFGAEELLLSLSSVLLLPRNWVFISR